MEHNKSDTKKNTPEKQLGVLDRLLFLHLFSITILFLIIVTSYYHIEKNNFNNNLMEKTILIHDILEISSIDPIVNTIAYDRIDQAIEILYKKNKEIVYIEIYDPTAHVIAFVGKIPEVHMGIEEINQLFKKDATLKHQIDINQDYNESITYLNAGDRHLGLIRLGFTKEYLQEQLKRNIQYFLGLFIMAIAVTSLIFYIFTNKWIVSPIIHVSKIMKNYGQDELPTLLGNIKKYNKSITKDEIGTMSTAFEWLISSIIKQTNEKEKAEEALILANQIVNQSHAVAFLWKNAEGWPIEFVSSNVEEVFGYSAEDLLAGKVSYAEIIHPLDLKRVGEEVIRYSKNKGTIHLVHEPYRIFTKNEQIKWVDDRTTIRKDENGEITHYQGIVLDITERRQAEEEKINAQKIAGEQKKLAFVGQIAGKIAHDFNNILGIIMGNTELSLIHCKDSKIKKALELIFDQTVRGKNLTKNLVAFAKDQEPKQEFFQINEKVDLVINLLKKDLEGIEIIKEEKSGIPELLADPGMIEHGLVNLIQNSIHALSMIQHPKITIRTYNLDNNIYLEIEDNGCGIPKEHIEKIYEPSFTLKGNKDVKGLYKNGIKGTGYGMANVKKYIEQHKGSISVESGSGSGTKFTIKIPIIKKELTYREKTEIREELSYFGKYILLVEDEQAISDVQYRILTQEPCYHKVEIANSGQAAIDLVNKNKYDFISLDYILPGDINGMDVYNHIRETNKTVPILFISGNIEFLESIKELKQKDANVDHLSKPCQNKDYVNGINKLMESSLKVQK